MTWMLRIFVLMCLMLTGCTSGLSLYVAKDGHDAWSGRQAVRGLGKAGPFATLERARDELRALKESSKLPAGPVTVFVGGGIYERDKTFTLTSADSGTAQQPIVYRALPGEQARLIGGREIKRFVPVTDQAILNRLDPAARGKVMQADLKAMGITDFGQPTPGGNRFELYFADRPMTLSRWPNDDYVKIAEVVGGKPTKSHGFVGDLVGKFTYEGDRPTRWKDDQDIWLSGYWFWDWADQYQKLDAIDTEKKLFSIKEPYHVYGYRKGARYYALNLLSEIDAPGEWYLDREAGVLYFWPPAQMEGAQAFVSMLGTLVSMKDVQHVTFRGLTLEMCRGTALVLEGGANDMVAGCRLRNIGGKAVTVQGGLNHGLVGCDVYDIGDGGVSVEGGDRMKLTPGGHYVVNNNFYRYSLNSKTYRPAVSVNGMGHRVAHNEIHDAPHMAIQFTGNEHVMEYNHIYRVCTDTDDAGAIYTGRDWTWRDNVIRYNYFHDMGTFKTWVGVQSVYLDDMVCATKVYGNVFYKGGRAVLVGGGRNNLVENNIFVDCSPAVHIDERATGWAKSFLDDPNNSMITSLRKTPYQEPPWSTRYPDLVKLLGDEPNKAKYNVVQRNICVGGKWLDLHNGLTDKVVTIKDNLVNEDPLFVDAAKYDFRLHANSPAFKLGFKPIPMEKIGLYQDELRASWPPASQPG